MSKNQQQTEEEVAQQQEEEEKEIVQQQQEDELVDENGQVLHCTKGGRSGPKLNFEGAWYKNAQKIGFENASKYTLIFLAGDAHFTQVKVQTSKDETQAVVKASFQGADFTGSFDLDYNADDDA